ncbi:hypothetical protein F5X68DRAFT_261025 [Plectosphaerella plurivora]|uniref:Uncharacterized protein n=1 Tax=Plectosphaerella plurivora TaxID=936078 RepID=A0A9P8VEH6_9PEZI|nr:hypothetical protein F5X68DRAFT_261025 [Plectosphaerella plurivora]
MSAQWEVGIAAAIRWNPKLEYLTIGLDTDQIDQQYARHNRRPSRYKHFLRDICLEYTELAMEGLYLYNDIYHPEKNLVEHTQGWVSWDALSYDNMPNLRYLFFSTIDMDVWEGLPELVQTRMRSTSNSTPGLIGVGAHSISGDMRDPHWSNDWSVNLPGFFRFPAMLEHIPMLSLPASLSKEAAETPEMRFEHMKGCTWLTHFYCPVDTTSSVAAWFPSFLEVLASLKNLQALWVPFTDGSDLHPYFDLLLDSDQGSDDQEMQDAEDVANGEDANSEDTTQEELDKEYAEYYDTELRPMVLRMAKANPLLTWINLGAVGTWRVIRPQGAATGEEDVRLSRLDVTENRQNMPHFFYLSETAGCEKPEAVDDTFQHPLSWVSNKIPALYYCR